MSIDELMQDRYKVIAAYPEIERHNIRVGDIITRSENAMYTDKTQDGTPVVAIDHDIFPANFKKLQWWEERKVEDLPEYVKGLVRPIAQENPIFKVGKFIHPNKVRIYNANKGFSLVDLCNHYFLPATEQEYLSYQSKK